jgi:hypothetical protein
MGPRASLSVHMMRAAPPVLIIKQISVRQRVILILMGTYTINAICPHVGEYASAPSHRSHPRFLWRPLISSGALGVSGAAFFTSCLENSGSRQIVYDLFNFKQGTKECIAEIRVGGYLMVGVWGIRGFR